jgi:SOS-response transcriptional repressor LexA
MTEKQVSRAIARIEARVGKVSPSVLSEKGTRVDEMDWKQVLTLKVREIELVVYQSGYTGGYHVCGPEVNEMRATWSDTIEQAVEVYAWRRAAPWGML